MSERKTYAASDMARYHSGQMSAAEMHDLEKAALDDLLLADALEGYALTQTPAVDLQVLRDKLQIRLAQKEKKRPVFLLQPWLRMVAVFLLLAVAGWIIFQTTRSANETNNSKNEEVALSVKKPAADSNSSTLPNLPPALATDSIYGIKDVAVLGQDKVKKAQRQMATAKTGKVSRQKEIAQTEAGYKTEARKMDDNKPGNAIVAAPVDQTLFLPVPQSDSASRLQSQPRTQSAAIEEVVVRKAKRQATAGRVTITGNLTPEGGVESFDRYIENNADSTGELKNEVPAGGEVELSFDVDDEGLAQHITVTKPLCKKCDAEAIRLLKDGPKWKGKENNGKVKIKFQ